MGGASRNERRRRQEAVRGTAGARRPDVGRIPGSGGDNRVKVGIAVAVVLVVFFVGAYVLLNRPSSTPPAAASYPVSADGVVVTAGRPAAPVTIDVYEDYLCPFCERLEKRSGPDLAKALNDGQVKVNYHALDILADNSVPAGYSTLAANAALCAVPANIWPAYHERLFAEQPAEGGPGLSVAELTKIGTDLGAGPDFGTCVSGNANAGAITAASAAAVSDPSLKPQGQFGTPTVAVGGKKIDVSASDWLSKVIAGG